MSIAIRILIVENNSSDVEFICNELKKGGIHYTSEVVQNEMDYRKALKALIPDVILSDYALPGFSGDAAFEIRNQLSPDTPFIFVSGTVGEEKSIEYIKNGVTDYVLKDKLFSLTVKVRRALNDVREKGQKKKAEDDLQRSEKLFRALIEKSKDMITLANRKDKLVYGSPFITTALGYSVEELVNMRLFGIVHPDDIPELRESRDKLLNNPGGSFNFQHRRRHKNGNWIWCEGTVTNLLDDPAIGGILTNFRDISAHKKAEHELVITNGYLQKALNDFQKIMDASLDLICSIDAEGRFAMVSSASERILGFSPDELEGRKYIELVLEDDVENTNQAAAGIMNGHPVTLFENRYIRKNGTIVPMIWSATWDNQDQLMYCVAKDVTGKKIAEMERTKMVNDLMLRNKELEQFAYIISHNLRAPIANIIGATSILSDPDLTVEDKDILNKGINNSVLKLDEVVQDLSYILQAKGEVIEPKEIIYFSQLVETIKTSIINLIDKYGIKIEYDFTAVNELATIKPYLYSIFYNLISNSVKYRRQEVNCVVEIKSSLVSNRLVLTFTDNGRGINLKKNGGQVFGLYKRFHTDIEGKGMGLFMVKTQVEILGGKIHIKSVENEGTAINIEFEL